MAILFNKGDVVKVATSTLQGPVLDITLDKDFVLQYLVAFSVDGVDHQRWFKETDLNKA